MRNTIRKAKSVALPASFNKQIKPLIDSTFASIKSNNSDEVFRGMLKLQEGIQRLKDQAAEFLAA